MPKATVATPIFATAAALATEISARAEADALLAPLDSPAFTNTPTALTAPAGTNTTQLATCSFANTAAAAAASAIVDSAPALLDTLKELADSLGDDPNFATTITNLIGAKLSALPVGQTLFVDATNGHDSGPSIGLRGRLDRPFASIRAALDAAVAGDLVWVWPATYDERNLFKHLVNQHYEGATVHYTGTDVGAIFDTSSTGTNGAVTCRITGSGVFIRDAATDAQSLADFEQSAVLLSTDPANDIFFQGYYNGINDPGQVGNQQFGIRAQSGTVRLDFPRYGSGIMWSDGDCFVLGEEIEFNHVNSDYAIWSVPGFDASGLDNTYRSGGFWILSRRIFSTAALETALMAFQGTNSARVWMPAISEIIGTTGPTEGLINISGNKVYLGAQKLTTKDNGGPQIIVSGGEFWGDVQKLGTTGTGTGGGVLLTGGITHHLDIGHVDDTAGGAFVVHCTGGDHRVDIGKAVMSATGTGVSHSGGTMTLSVRLLDTSANSGTTPVVVSSDGLTLEFSKLKAHASVADVITAAAAHTVTCNYVLDPDNKGVHSNVTVLHDPTL